MIDRALNQKTARTLGFEAFLDLAARLDCAGVEPRGDLGRPMFDGIAPDLAGRMARDRGLRLLGLSEVYGFNVWDAEREAQICALRDLAEASGAETLSLIPCVDGRPVLPLAAAMARIARLFEGSPVLPLIEPIGFAASSLRSKRPLAEAMAEVPGFGMVHDTFQHAISGEAQLFPSETAMIHISGISDPAVPLDDSGDARRILLEAGDRCRTLAQIRALREGGCAGPLSFECTTAAVWDRPDLEQAIRASFGLIEAALHA
ncbi:TIM barrel protein [Mangrovicoccus ximenensis]|uniref:TIM barrel protein n=1 Tax=Mangrovicoccus ximenensis TaxID=1911570 RepID=UPI000D39B2A9|nr:TIM barrel protein [Mangrovicoccus ximenensis]